MQTGQPHFHILEGYEVNHFGNLDMKHMRLFGSSQYGVTKRISHLTNQKAFQSEMTSPACEERAVDLYLNFSKAFVNVSHNILINKMMNYGLDLSEQ